MTRAKTRTWTYFVSGTGTFPIDMLRHDRCTPAHENDSAQIERSFDRGSGRLVTHVMVKSTVKAPTTARWKSFGWEVGALNEATT